MSDESEPLRLIQVGLGGWGRSWAAELLTRDDRAASPRRGRSRNCCGRRCWAVSVAFRKYGNAAAPGSSCATTWGSSRCAPATARESSGG